MIGRLIAALVQLVANIVGYKSTEVAQKRAKLRDKAKAERAVDKHVEAGQKAVRDEDLDEINRRVHKATGSRLIPIAILATALAASGCAHKPVVPEVVYIPESARIVAIDHGDPPVRGFFVPKEVFARLLEKAERWDAYVETKGD